MRDQVVDNVIDKYSKYEVHNHYHLMYSGKKINIEEGKWLTEGNNYLTIHRMAVSSDLRRKGIASLMVKNA